MTPLAVMPSCFDFHTARAGLQRAVEAGLIAGASYAVLRHQDVVDLGLIGFARVETSEVMRVDHLFRVFSNTKLFTSIAVMQLVEQGLLDLDEPVYKHIPQLGDRRVLKPHARRLDDTEPANGPITVRHLLTHTAGLSYGIFDPGTPIFTAYNERRVLDANQTLAQMMDVLAELPLTFHPGTRWEYSVATDVLSRLVEVVTGQAFADALLSRVLQPLGMSSTGFFVPAEQQHHLAGYYQGASLTDPLERGLKCVDDALPYPGAFRRPMPRQSGGGGLVSSLPDMVALMRSLLPGGPSLLKRETLVAMMSDQLPPQLSVFFPETGPQPWRGHGLAGAVLRAAGPLNAPGAAGEFSWGGIAGTQWWIHPRTQTAGVLMLQRVMGYAHPVVTEFKLNVYAAVDV